MLRLLDAVLKQASPQMSCDDGCRNLPVLKESLSSTNRTITDAANVTDAIQRRAMINVECTDRVALKPFQQTSQKLASTADPFRSVRANAVPSCIPMAPTRLGNLDAGFIVIVGSAACLGRTP